MDAGTPCIDRDRDGFGLNCTMGSDCDDRDPASTNECRSCMFPEAGCACQPGQGPMACYLPDLPLENGNVMCREGTRFCRDGMWTQCEDVHSYVVTPDPTAMSTAIVDPDATPEPCSPCAPNCFIVRDPLSSDGGVLGNGVSYAGGQGLTLAPADGGGSGGDGGDGGDGGGGFGVGCAGLSGCCSTLGGVPQSQSNCMTIVADGNDAACNSALQVYCPGLITGPLDGCTIGGSSLDVDCDGIPDELDECTPATVATNPACQGNVLPLATTNNQTIFHVLDKGERGSNALALEFKVQNADVYFLMDMTGTMGEERNNLVSSMTTGNVVECALLKNCCERQELSAADKTACLNVVNGENQNNCRNAEITYCTSAHMNLVDCPDLDFDGLPDNHLKTQGVVGAVRCLVGSSYFGTGLVNEIPFSGVGDNDELAFRHYVDMGPDVNRVRSAIASYRTNYNEDYPEGQMIGLYSLLTGKGAVMGHRAASIPERLGAGCPANTFGYPCFRRDTIPIVVMFTDDVMHNGPPGYSANYATSYPFSNSGRSPTSGYVRFTPSQAEAFATAYNLGDVRNQFVIAAGNTTHMSGDYPAAITGCGAATDAPEAVFRFTISPTTIIDPLTGLAGISLTPVNVKFRMNTDVDTNHPVGNATTNALTPATDFPVVLTLYRGIPAAIQPPSNVGETRINPIPSGPDLTYLTYIGTTGGTNESAPGFLGGISGCGADGATNEVVFTFRPTVNARVVIDAVESAFATAISLHEGLPSQLPPNPTTLGSDRIVLVGPTGNAHDTFSTARTVDEGGDGKIDGDYVQYIADMIATQNSGTGTTYNQPGGKAGQDDYDDSVVACGVNPTGPDAVFKFDVQSPRRVRIDTEGSNFNTVLSLHDGAPPQVYSESGITGNTNIGSAKYVGAMSGNTVTNTAYRLESDASGTGSLTDTVAPMCGLTPTPNANDAFFSFRLTKPTRLSLSAMGGNTATGSEAVNTPGQHNLGATTTPPPAAAGEDPVLNEFVFAHNGGDTREYVEIFGRPNTSYGAYRILQIEGDSESNRGQVDRVVVVGTTNSSGLWVSAFSSGTLENGASTLLLVENWTATVGDDLDADDDGVLEAQPWTRIVDAVAVEDGGGSDFTYAQPVLPVSLSGGSSVVGGASRLPSGRDTDAVADWARNDYDGEGLPGIGFDPAVVLYSSAPGNVTEIDAADPNDDGSVADSNSHNTASSALNLGDIHGQLDTRVINADLGHANTTNDYPDGTLSCNTFSGAEPPGAREHVYKFTPSAHGTVRVEVSKPTSGSAYHAVAIFDGPPPLSGATGIVQLFDATKVGPPPDASCTAYSESGRLYWACANARTWAVAQANCNVAGGHLARIDSAAENTFVGDIRTATQAWLGGQDCAGSSCPNSSSSREFHWRDTNPGDIFWTGGSGGSPVGGRFTSWASGQPSTTSEDCVGFASTGSSQYRWSDLNCSNAYHYVCEDPTPPSPAPHEDASTAYLIGSEVGANGDPKGRALAYRGSTRRMDSNYDGLLMSACGATQSAPDVVFKITPSATMEIEIDTTGSSFPAIIGLFEDTIAGAPNYMGCDAPGVAPNTNVTGSNPPSAEPLRVTLNGQPDLSKTYYVVLTGTATNPDGAYQIRFTDINAASASGNEIACAMEADGVPARAEADFYANQTYYVVVESHVTTGTAYDMTVHSLFRTREEFENPAALNEHGNTAFEIADPYRSKSTVIETSTAGMAANYTAGSMGSTLTCGGATASASPDAVYTFTPSINTSVKISANMPGKTPIVGLFRGQPDSAPTTTDLGAFGNTNESTETAYVVNMRGPSQTLTGNTSMMTSDIDGTLLSCGAAPDGRDAVFRFTLTEQTQVQIDASASAGPGMVGDPVIALFRDFALERPAPFLLENDGYTDAQANPSPTPNASDNWLSYTADMSNLTPSTQAQVSVSNATNLNEVVSPSTLQGAFDLGDVWNTRVSVGGASTMNMLADYGAQTCGGHADAPDAIYEFYTSQAGDVRISTTPQGFDTVIQLYDGTNGAPLRKVDAQTVTVDLGAGAVVCGNGNTEIGEECDDGNTIAGDGCDAACQFEPGVWTCDDSYFDAGDGCDCGCGIVDPDCGGPTGTCDRFPANGCAAFTELMIDPDNNARCFNPDGVWRCPVENYGFGDECHCGCGALDPDCGGDTSADACGVCDAVGSCSTGACPGNISAGNNATCPVVTANNNDKIAAAQYVDLDAGGIRHYLGDTSGLSSDVQASMIECSAMDGAPDSIFEFSLRRTTKVEIDATNSPNPPVLALFDSGAISGAPDPLPLENDDAADADVNPAPTPQLSGSWVRYSSDLSHFTISAQPQIEVSNRDNVNNGVPTNLFDPMNRRVTAVDSDTSVPTSAATFAAPVCGGPATADAAHDQLYRFVPTTSGPVRISVRYPDTVFDPVIALYDGRGRKYTNWRSGEPNGSGDCGVLLDSNGAWDDVSCTDTKRWICEFEQSSPSAPAGCTHTGPELFGGHTYFYCTDLRTWDSAKSACEAAGGYLLQIDGTAESTYLFGSSKLGGDSWTGANDRDGEAAWYWARGSDVGGGQFCRGQNPCTATGSELPLTLADLATKTTAISVPQHEKPETAIGVPIADGGAFVYTGSTAGMGHDVDAALLQCGASNTAPDAVWGFAISEPMDVEISTEGSSYSTVLGLFDSPFVRPSLTERRSPPAARVELYDIDDLPGQPEPGCRPFDYNTHRYWLCATERPWDGADAKCRAAGHTLAVIEDSVENEQLRQQIAPTGRHHHIGLQAREPLTSWGSAPAGRWVDGSTASYRNFAPGEPNQVENAGARMLFDDASGRWADTPSSWQKHRYICEQTSAPALPQPPLAGTPQAVELFGSTRRFVGSTVSTASSVGGLIGCGAVATAPDAAFRIRIDHPTDLEIDFSNSFVGSVVGLFKDAIGVQGYADAGSVCEQRTGSAPSGDGVVNVSLSAANYPAFYYVVLTGSTPAAGRYDLEFEARTTHDSAFRLENDTLADALSRPLGVVDHNWVIKTADMANLETDLLTSRTVDMIGTDTNESHVAPYAPRNLGDTAGQQVIVLNASTAGMADDYAAPTCGGSSDAPDAIYTFRPTSNATVRALLSPSGHDAVVAIFDGSGGEYPLLKGEATSAPVTLDNENEAPTMASAEPVVIGDPVTFIGDLTAMDNDLPTVDGDRPWDASDLNGGDSEAICNPHPTGQDAFFQFTLGSSRTVVIDSAGTAFKHTLSLFGQNPITAPAAVTAEHNTSAAALAAPVALTGNWQVLQGSTAGFTPGADTRTTLVAGSGFQNDDPVQDLGTLALNTQLVTSGADTSAAAVDADYLRECGSSDAADDMVFKFRSGASAQNVHIGVNNPAPAFPVVLQLWDGTNGDPLTAGEIDPVPTLIGGNDSYDMAHNVGTLGATPVAFNGDTSGFMSDTLPAALYDRALNYGGDSANMCNAGAATSDAFYRFTLAAPARVRLQVAGDATSYPHTLALYRNTPPLAQQAPIPAGYDTLALATAAADVTVDDRWLHYSTDMSTLGIDGLAEVPLRAGIEFQNAAGVQDLQAAVGTVSGKQLQPAPAALADTTGTGSSYPAPMCGGAAAANDMIFKVRTGAAATNLRFAVNNPAPGFNPVLAVYEGPPLTSSEIGGSITDLAALGNINEAFDTAHPALAGARATFTGNASAMLNDYAGSQFRSFGSACTPDAAGPDAFLEVEVVGIPKSARDSLVLWVDAADEDYITLSGSAVSSWRDKGGAGNHAGQGTAARQPLRQLRTNGYAIEFNPGGDPSAADSSTEDSLLRDPAAGDAPVSVFAVWKLLGTGFVTDARLLATNTASSGFGLAMSADGATGTARLQYRDSGTAVVDMTGALGAATSPMLSAVTHAAGGAITTYLNGAQHATGSGRSAGTAWQRFRIGANSDGFRGLPADVHELIVVDRVVSAAERQEIEGYLAHKWGFASSLPAGHPYRTAAPTRTVEISSADTAFAHTFSFFANAPMSRPAATAGTAYDTSDLAVTNRLTPAVDGRWYVRDATTAGLNISELTSLTKLQGADGADTGTAIDFTNADSDHHAGGVPDLGDVVGLSLKTSGASTAALVGDYPSSTLACVSDDSAKDAIFKFTPSADTTVSIRADGSGWNPIVGLYDGTEGIPAGPRYPRDINATEAPPVKLGFVPSNYDHGSLSFNNSVSWTCSGTTTFDSTTCSFTTTTTCSDTPAERPEVTAATNQTVSGGPQVCILRAVDFTIASGHTLRLVGDKPVVIAVDGNATIGGIIDASASGTTQGAGGNWSCGSASGTNGSGSSSFGGGGGGGGGFRTAGGNGGDGDVNNNGVGGSTRGNSNLSPLIGGCNGGRGGGCSTNGGAGGGAFQVAVAGTLTLTGTLRANGGNGTNGCGSEGGGTGGGSGGGILVEAANLMNSGTIQTNGGSGGDGAGGGNGGNGSTSSSNPGSTGGGSLTNGGGGGGGGYGRSRVVDAAGNENETLATAQSVTIGARATFEGDTSVMAANLASSYYDSATTACFASGAPDAFFTFTLTQPTPVRISTAGSDFDTTLALWNSNPTSLPRPSAAMPNPFSGATYTTLNTTLSRHDTKSLAATNTLGDIDSTWKVMGGNTTNLTIEGLGAPVVRTQGTHFTTAQTDQTAPASVANLGAIADSYVRTSGATTSGLNNDYGENTLQCGLSNDNAPDAIFKFTGTAGHTLRVGAHNPAAGFTSAYVAVFEADPGEKVLTRSEDSPPAITNVSPPSLGCGTPTSYGGHLYYLCTSAANWQNARNNCESAGMHLVRIDSDGEQTHVAGMTTADAWLGGYDAQGGNAWRWTDNGEQFSSGSSSVGGRYVNWNTSEPSSSGDCLQMLQSNSRWDDSSCTNTRQYVCEANLADLPLEAQSMALGPTQRFDGNTSGSAYGRDVPAALWDQDPMYGSDVCNAHATAADAMFDLTVRGADAYHGSLIHRWGFEGARSTVYDAVGGEHGTVVNTVLAGDGDLYLQGGSTDEYVNLPDPLLSPLTNATIEMWVTWFGTGAGNWQRIFDFGNNTGGEDAQGTGNSYLFLAPDDTTGRPRLVFRRSGGSEVIAAGSSAFPTGAQTHVAAVFDDTNNALRLYVNGTQVASATLGSSDTLAGLSDVNNWLGRSQFSTDAEFGGIIHELRVYNTAFSATQVTDSRNAGIDPLGTLPVNVTLDTTGSAFDTVLSIWDADGVGSLACGVTDAGGKARIEALSLTPGVYRVGVTGAAGATQTSGAFQLSVLDDVYATNAASRVGCSAANGYVDVPIVAGKEYFAVVKGGSSSQSGGYTLSLADLSAITTAQGCGADLTAPDAYFYFNVAAAGGRNVAIDMNNSTLAGAFELFDPSGTSLGCQTSGNSRTWNLPQADGYFVAVRGTNTAAGNAERAFELSIRDNALTAASYCDFGPAAASADIEETLPAGTYYVGVTGNSSTGGPTSGTYHVTFENTNVTGVPAVPLACAAGDLQWPVTAGTPYYVIVKGATAADQGAYTLHIDDVGAVPDMSCGGVVADDAAPDGYVGFSVAGTKDVTIDLENSTLDAVFELWRDNGATDTKIACAARGSAVTEIASQLTAGNYYVKVRGTDSASGAGEQPFQISIRDDDVQRAADCSNGAATTGTSFTKTLAPGTYYVGVKPQAGQTAGSYSIAVRDTSFALTGGTPVACDTDRVADVSAAANTDYYVLVKGATAADKGAFGLTATDIGAIDNTATDLVCADLAAPDAYYEFVVGDANGPAGQDIEVSITNGFSGGYQLYRNGGPDTSFANDTPVGGCQTGTHTYTDLSAGTYYLVVKGTTTAAGAAQQPLQVSIKDLDGMGSIACADGTSGSPAIISSSTLAAPLVNAQGQLPAGTYYAAFSGQAGNGAYELVFADQTLGGGSAATLMQCTQSQALTATLTPNTDYYVVVKGDGATSRGAYTLAVSDLTSVPAFGSCTTDLAAPDGYAAFTLTSPRDVTIDMSGSALDGAFQVFTAAGAAVPGCDCADIDTPRTCSFAAGTYYVAYRGYSVANGNGQQPFQIVLRDQDALGALACGDGLAVNGHRITHTLAAGTYYVGIIPTDDNTVADLDYRLQIKDAASTVGVGAPQLDCGANEASASVVAGRDYYVLVKGLNADDSGDYGLTVQDLSGVPAFNCGDDTNGGDAFYSFTVTEPDTQVTIDTKGSALGTVVALFPDAPDVDFGTDQYVNGTTSGPPDGRPDDMIACDSDSGTDEFGTRYSLLTRTLQPGNYFVVVRARQGQVNTDRPFNISVHDSGSAPSTMCDAGTTGDPARIRAQLAPGTYWVALGGVQGQTPESGDYSLRLRDYAPIAEAAPRVGSCGLSSNGQTIFHDVTAGNPYYVLVKGATAGAQGTYKLTVENFSLAGGMGCGAEMESPDAFYKFTLDEETDLQIDVGGIADTVIAVYPDDVPYFGTNYAQDVDGVLVDCDDDGGEAGGGGPGSSRIVATLGPGDYYLVVKGKGEAAKWGAESQPFTVSIRDTTGNSNITCALASSPKITQTLPPGDYTVVVSDDGAGGEYDIRFRDLSAIENAAVPIGCNVTERTVTATLEANKRYYAVVKGHGAASARGPYGLTVESVDSGATNMGCNADPRSPDAFFKFTVTRQTDVTIDTNDYDANPATPALDTVIALYPGDATVFGSNYAQDAFAAVIPCDDDGGDTPGASKISATLAAGDYYVVVKGRNANWGEHNRPFDLSIRDDGATRAIACAGVSGAGTPSITQTLQPGDYVVALSDTNNAGTSGSGGAYSITFSDLSTSGAETGMQIGCAQGTLDGGDGNMDGKPDGIPVVAGEPYYVVVKGNSATDSGDYTLSVEDLFSSQAATGSTPIACAPEGTATDAVYPAGDYYAVVTGQGGAEGPYELNIRDIDPFSDYNRLACAGPDGGETGVANAIAESGPNGTAVIEADLQPGTHYVVVKGDGPGQTGGYRLNIRDVVAHPDNRLACADAESNERLEYDVEAGKNYTVLLKGDAANEQGAYNIKFYDELGLQSGGGQRLQCQTICPNIPEYQSGSASCTGSQRMNDSFTASLGADTYYMTVKGRRADEKGFYELQIGDPAKGSNVTRYTPPTWQEIKDALHPTDKPNAKVLPVVSCNGSSPSGLCDETMTQARNLAAESGAKDRTTGQGLVQVINANGTGIGSGLAMAVRDLANHLSMDITLSVVNNPGFTIDIQKCLSTSDPGCTAAQVGCNDSSPTPRNTLNDCRPGATPRFVVQFTNPEEPDNVDPNPNDPNGGYHFKLQIVGDHQYLLDEVPVYIIPTDNMAPTVPPPGAGQFQTSGTYVQEVYGAGCNYFLMEGEASTGSAEQTCNDGMDNNGDLMTPGGGRDRGNRVNADGDYDDPMEYPPDPGCRPGSCLDGDDNDGDGKMDIEDPDCFTNERQYWSDLFFKADIPAGTSINFDMCTANTAEALDTECSSSMTSNFSRLATVTSVSGSCANDSECQDVNVGGTLKDGFCGEGGQCQFIDPPKMHGFCSSDLNCPNGPINGETYLSFCDGAECRYARPPAEIMDHLRREHQGRPYVKMKVTLNANSDASAAPTLFDWYMTYECRPGL